MFVSEESSLVDMFIFDILITYVESLSLAHDDDKVLGKSAAEFTIVLLLMLTAVFYRFFDFVAVSV